MEFFNLADYVNLSFRLGHISASMGVHMGEDEKHLSEWNDILQELASSMDRLGLTNSREYAISFLQQIGDLAEMQDGEDHTVLNMICEEAQARMAQQEGRIREDAGELRQHEGTIPEGLRAALSPSNLDALDPLARADYQEATRCMERGDVNGAVLLLGRCVEVEFKGYYAAISGTIPGNKSWADLDTELLRVHRNDRVSYVIFAVRDVRINHRNTVVHPGKDYYLSEEDAVRKYYGCSEALARMAESKVQRDMPRLS